MIRISDRYIFTQVFRATSYAVIALSMFLVLGRIFQEIRPLVVEQHVPLPLVGKFILCVFPVSLMFTIPWGFMAAVLLVMGRLSSEQELNAMQLGGMNLPRIAMPVIFLGALLSALCLWINVNVVPVARASMDNIAYEAVENDPKSLIKPGVITSELANLRIFVQQKDGENLHGLHLYRLPDKKKNETQGEYVYAEDASIGVDPERKQIKLTLNSTYIERPDKNGNLDIYVASAAPWRVDLTRKKKFSPSGMTNDQIRAFLAAPPPEFKEAQRPKYVSSIIQRYSFAMASLAFSFIAVPLSVARRRKDSSTGILFALMFGAAYFVFSILAQKSDSTDTATLLLWLPNVLCVLFGIMLFYRVRFR
jgi:lipopolysaccharide export LptBFGC system permease protein LptF